MKGEICMKELFKEIVETLPELPEKWKWVKLNELILIESGKRPKGGSRETGVPSLGGEQLLPNGEINWEKLRYIPEDFFDNVMKKGKVKVKDILVVKDGATTGKTAYVRNLPFRKVAVNEHVFILRPLEGSGLLNEYLFFVLFSEIGQKQIRDLFHGAAQGGITQQNIQEILIPLPPLEEQKRIVARIEEILSRVEQAKKLREEASREVEAVMRSALHEVFSKAEEKWERVKLGDVLKEDRKGVNPQEYPNEKFWLVTMDCIESNSGRLIKKIELEGRQIKSMKYMFNSTHVLYGKLRPYLNKVYVPSNGEGLCTTEFIPFVVVKAKREYVAHYLRTNKVVNFAMSNLTGTRQPRVNIHTLLEYPIPLPPIEEQKHIVEYLDQLQEKVEAVRRYQEETKDEIEAITQAVLRKAFSGEL